MKLVFDDSYPPEQMTAEYWQEQLADAVAEWLLKEMERGRIPPPGLTLIRRDGRNRLRASDIPSNKNGAAV